MIPPYKQSLNNNIPFSLINGKCVSELHALSRQQDYIVKRSDGALVLHCNPYFLAKTQLPNVKLKPIVLLTLPGEGADLLLCSKGKYV